jgi:peptide/nickel transport system ATP-binding protein
MLEVSGLKTYYYVDVGVLKAVDGVSFNLTKGEALGIAGESGCGKSTLAFSILKLIKPPGRTIGGKVFFEGNDILSLSTSELRKIRGSKISLIPQSVMSSFNPVYKVGEQIAEAIMTHQMLSRAEAKTMAFALIESVKLDPLTFHKYPHELSGGMLQRAFLAMAIACNPKILIADEPTTALDVVTQAYILMTLKEDAIYL